MIFLSRLRSISNFLVSVVDKTSNYYEYYLNSGDFVTDIVPLNEID